MDVRSFGENDIRGADMRRAQLTLTIHDGYLNVCPGGRVRGSIHMRTRLEQVMNSEHEDIHPGNIAFID